MTGFHLSNVIRRELAKWRAFVNETGDTYVEHKIADVRDIRNALGVVWLRPFKTSEEHSSKVFKALHFPMMVCTIALGVQMALTVSLLRKARIASVQHLLADSVLLTASCIAVLGVSYLLLLHIIVSMTERHCSILVHCRSWCVLRV